MRFSSRFFVPVILPLLGASLAAVAWASVGRAGVVVHGQALRSGKDTDLALSEAELGKYRSHRARKGLLLTPRLRVVSITRASSPE